MEEVEEVRGGEKKGETELRREKRGEEMEDEWGGEWTQKELLDRD
jgi:hypothetical protein